MVRKAVSAAVAVLAIAACDQSPTQPETELVNDFAAASWDYKVNGGGFMQSFGNDGGLRADIFVQVSITEDVDGKSRGQVQYEVNFRDPTIPRDDFKWHGVMDGFAIGDVDGNGNRVIEVCGATEIQEGEFTPRFGIAILDVADGPDRLRQSPSAVNCEGALYDGSWPGVMQDGDFRVKDDT